MTKRCFGWRLSTFSSRVSYGLPRQEESLVTVLVANSRRDLISRAARRSNPPNISSEPLCSVIFLLVPLDAIIVVMEAMLLPPPSDGPDDASSGDDSDRTICCSVLNSASTL